MKKIKKAKLFLREIATKKLLNYFFIFFIPSYLKNLIMVYFWSTKFLFYFMPHTMEINSCGISKTPRDFLPFRKSGSWNSVCPGHWGRISRRKMQRFQRSRPHTRMALYLHVDCGHIYILHTSKALWWKCPVGVHQPIIRSKAPLPPPNPTLCHFPRNRNVFFIRQGKNINYNKRMMKTFLRHIALVLLSLPSLILSAFMDPITVLDFFHPRSAFPRASIRKH